MTDNLITSSNLNAYHRSAIVRSNKPSKCQALCLTIALLFGSLTGSALAAPAATGVTVDESAQVTPPVTPATPAVTDNTQSDNSDKVSINTASAETLAKVMNGVGLKKARAIIDYREQYGPFNKLEDLKQVPGIGNALLERNRDHLTL